MYSINSGDVSTETLLIPLAVTREYSHHYSQVKTKLNNLALRVFPREFRRGAPPNRGESAGRAGCKLKYSIFLYYFNQYVSYSAQ